MSRANMKRRREEKEMKEKGYIECGYCAELVKPSSLKCACCGKWFSSGKQALAILLAITVVLSLGGAYSMMQPGGQEAYVPSSTDTPDRIIGTGANEFWSRSTSHPSWVTNEVQARPILIFTHSEGCGPCNEQSRINEKVYPIYKNYITYYDLLSGTDEPHATDSFSAYDPNGAPHYVPLTTILTTGPDNMIIWHSWEGVVDEATLSGWIEDAITYHNANG